MALALAKELASRCLAVDAAILRAKLEETTNDEWSSDETTPTTVSECSELTEPESGKDQFSDEADSSDVAEEGYHPSSRGSSSSSTTSAAAAAAAADPAPAAARQLGPGIYHDDDDGDSSRRSSTSAGRRRGKGGASLAPMTPGGASRKKASSAATGMEAGSDGNTFSKEETLFVFDWDDTVLPSSWLQRQGLRLDEGSVVRPWHREPLSRIAEAAAETLRLAKKRGTVVLVTNAERGWIELSCTKFIPSLLPVIENVKIVSARTTYETPSCWQPLDWKVKAFETEIARACGVATLKDPSKRKNIHSIGDSVHEREALLRATAQLPNCRWKSLKFVERPDIDQLVKQHTLVSTCFDQVVHHDDNLDLCINCS